MDFHEKLQQLRKQRGWTQEQLAEQLFVSQTAVSKWESGRGYPNLESLKAISALFSVSIDDLLSGGELIVLAPGVETFGEDPEIDRLIRTIFAEREEKAFGYKQNCKALVLQLMVYLQVLL